MFRVHTETLRLNTGPEMRIVDITAEVRGKLEACGLSEGQATVFIPGATGAVTTVEFEPGLVQDLETAFEKMAPVTANTGTTPGGVTGTATPT